MSEGEMNCYRITSMEEPGYERMAQMREGVEDTRVSSRRAVERAAAGIEAAT